MPLSRVNGTAPQGMALVDGTESTLDTSEPGLRVEISSDTIEDKLHASTLPLSMDLRQRFVAYALGDGAGAEIELLGVDEKQTDDPDEEEALVHYRRVPSPAAPAANDETEPPPLLHSLWQRRRHEIPDTRMKDPPPPPRGRITELKAFHDQNRSFAFVHYEDESRKRLVEALYFDADCEEWKALDLFEDTWNAFGADSQMAVFRCRDGRKIVYGNTTNYDSGTANLYLAFQLDGVWKTVVTALDGSPGTQFRLAPTNDPDHQFNLLKIDTDGVYVQKTKLRYDPVYRWELDLEEDDWRPLFAKGDALDLGELGPDRILPTPAGVSEAALLIRADDGHLYRVSGFDTGDELRIQNLTRGALPQGIETATVSVDERRGPGGGSPRAVVFALDKRHRLHVARQEPAGEIAPLKLEPWSPLGDEIEWLAAPMAMVHGPELFVVRRERRAGAGCQVLLLSQAPDSGLWGDQTIDAVHEEDEDPVDATTHTTEVRVYLGNGTPAQYAEVHLNAERSTTVQVNGIARQLTADVRHPVRAYTDEVGSLNLKMRAEALDAPEIGLRVAEVRDRTSEGKEQRRSVEMDPICFRPTHGVIQRLAGKDDRLGRITGEKLQTTVFKETLDKTSEEPTRRDQILAVTYPIAAAMRTSGNAAALATRGEPEDEDSFRRRLQVQGGDKAPTVEATLGPPSLGRLATAGGPPLVRASMRRWVSAGDLLLEAPGDGSFVSLVDATAWADIRHVVGDVLRWIKHAADEIAHIVIQVGRGIARFLLSVGGRVFEFFVDLTQAVGQLLEGLLAKVSELFELAEDLAKKLLSLLTALFDWQDIVQVNEVLRNTVRGGLLLAEELVEHDMKEMVDGLVDDLAARLKNDIQTLKTKYLDDVQLDSMREGQLKDPDGPDTHRRSQKVLHMNSVQCRYVGNAVKRQANRLPKSTVDHELREDATFKKLKNVLNEIGLEDFKKFEDPEDRTSRFYKAKELLFERVESGDYLTGALGILADIIIELIDVVGDGVKKIAGLILDLLAKLISTVRKLLTEEIPEIPLVGLFIKHLLGRKLVLLDIMTLPMAAAGTVLYKVLNKGHSPFKDLASDKTARAAAKPSLAGLDGDQRKFVEDLVKRSEDSNLSDDTQTSWRCLAGLWKALLTRSSALRDHSVTEDQSEKASLLRSSTSELSNAAFFAPWYCVLRWAARIAVWCRVPFELFFLPACRATRDLVRVADKMQGGSIGVQVFTKVYSSISILTGLVSTAKGIVASIISQGATKDEEKAWEVKEAIDGAGEAEGAIKIFGVTVSLITVIVGVGMSLTGFALTTLLAETGQFAGAVAVDAALTTYQGLACGLLWAAVAVGDLILVDQAARWDVILDAVGSFISALPDTLQFMVPVVAFTVEETAGLSLLCMIPILRTYVICPVIHASTSLIASIAATHYEESTDYSIEDLDDSTERTETASLRPAPLSGWLLALALGAAASVPFAAPVDAQTDAPKMVAFFVAQPHSTGPPCPKGWADYEPLKGRFVFATTDPQGLRTGDPLTIGSTPFDPDSYNPDLGKYRHYAHQHWISRPSLSWEPLARNWAFAGQKAGKDRVYWQASAHLGNQEHPKSFEAKKEVIPLEPTWADYSQDSPMRLPVYEMKACVQTQMTDVTKALPLKSVAFFTGQYCPIGDTHDQWTKYELATGRMIMALPDSETFGTKIGNPQLVGYRGAHGHGSTSGTLYLDTYRRKKKAGSSHKRRTRKFFPEKISVEIGQDDPSRMRYLLRDESRYSSEPLEALLPNVHLLPCMKAKGGVNYPALVKLSETAGDITIFLAAQHCVEYWETVASSGGRLLLGLRDGAPTTWAYGKALEKALPLNRHSHRLTLHFSPEFESTYDKVETTTSGVLGGQPEPQHFFDTPVYDGSVPPYLMLRHCSLQHQPIPPEGGPADVD